ncbi:hypothetical protein ERJ75_000905500 [Trypanosoma vivax]|nr:hypothetical protein ERJ75_000905500 [Trypanosoma vivax]
MLAPSLVAAADPCRLPSSTVASAAQCDRPCWQRCARGIATQLGLLFVPRHCRCVAEPLSVAACRRVDARSVVRQPGPACAAFSVSFCCVSGQRQCVTHCAARLAWCRVLSVRSAKPGLSRRCARKRSRAGHGLPRRKRTLSRGVLMYAFGARLGCHSGPFARAQTADARERLGSVRSAHAMGRASCRSALLTEASPQRCPTGGNSFAKDMTTTPLLAALRAKNRRSTRWGLDGGKARRVPERHRRSRRAAMAREVPMRT